MSTAVVFGLTVVACVAIWRGGWIAKGVVDARGVRWRLREQGAADERRAERADRAALYEMQVKALADAYRTAHWGPPRPEDRVSSDGPVTRQVAGQVAAVRGTIDDTDDTFDPTDWTIPIVNARADIGVAIDASDPFGVGVKFP